MTVQTTIADGKLHEASASILAPNERLRVAVHAVDATRRAALGRVVTEAGHVVVGTLDDADVVLADGDCPAGENPRGGRARRPGR